MHPQLALHRQSLHDREAFWLRAARDIHWHQPPSVAYGKTTLSEQAAPYAQGDGTWFPNAQREWPEAWWGARACRCAAHALAADLAPQSTPASTPSTATSTRRRRPLRRR